jgi:hypothetical protein
MGDSGASLAPAERDDDDDSMLSSDAVEKSSLWGRTSLRAIVLGVCILEGVARSRGEAGKDTASS